MPIRAIRPPAAPSAAINASDQQQVQDEPPALAADRAPRQRPDPVEAQSAFGEDNDPAEERKSYEIGYGKPPKHTRFKPGQSGNAKGRPRAAKSLRTIARETLTSKVPVRTATGEKRISRIEAVLHKTVEQAMKGNPRALAELLKLYAAAVPETSAHEQTASEEDLSATDLAILEQLKASLRAEGLS